MKNKPTKLALAKTTLRILSATALHAVVGGINATLGQGQSCVDSCTRGTTNQTM